MRDALSEYKQALADFARPGNRWATTGRVTYWAKAAGLDAERLVEDARAVGVRDRDSDLRRGWSSAHPQGANHAAGEWRPRAANKPKGPTPRPHFVRDCIEAGGGEADADAVRARSKYWWPTQASPRVAQTAAHLRALFTPGDFVFCFTEGEAGRLGVNLRTCGEWLTLVEKNGVMPGDKIVPNRFSGTWGMTKEGKRSLIAQECLGGYRYAVVEFDHLPISKQTALWVGVLKSPLAPLVVSLVHSGNKSIHAVLNFGCATLSEWEAARDKLKAFFCTDPDPAFRADTQSLIPRQGTRLAGAIRADTGALQELIFLNPTMPRGKVLSARFALAEGANSSKSSE